MSLSAREMLARVIRCEAEGEGEAGMKAVATIIMNRVHVAYGEYLRVCQGDLRKVLLQPFQFTCVMTMIGEMTNPQNIYNMSPEQIHYDIADWALSGNRFWGVNDCLWYYNPFSPDCESFFPRNRTGVFYTRINEHCFYTATPLYAET